MLGSTVDDVQFSLTSTIAAAVVALAIALVRTREKVARLEEWIRLHEEARRLRKEGK